MPFQYGDRSLRPPPPPAELGARPLVTLATASVGQVATANAAQWSGAGAALAYQWFRNDSAITNATNQSHSVQSAGTYYVNVKLTSAVRNKSVTSLPFIVL
jgi:hypothetical protein